MPPWRWASRGQRNGPCRRPGGFGLELVGGKGLGFIGFRVQGLGFRV